MADELGKHPKSEPASFFEQLRSWAKQVDKVVPELSDAINRPPSSKYRPMPLEQAVVPTLMGFSDELQVLKKKSSDDYNQLFEATQDFDEFMENSQEKLKQCEKRLNACRVHLLKYGYKPMPIDKSERKDPVTPRNLVCDDTPLRQPPTRQIEKTPELIDYGFSNYAVDVLLSAQKMAPVSCLAKSTAEVYNETCLKNSSNLLPSANCVRQSAPRNTPIPVKNTDLFVTPEQFTHSAYAKTKHTFRNEMLTPMQDIYESANDTLPDTPEVTSSLASLTFFDKAIAEADLDRLITPELKNIPPQDTPEEPILTSDLKVNHPIELVSATPGLPGNHTWVNNKVDAASPLGNMDSADDLPPTPELTVQYQWLNKRQK